MEGACGVTRALIGIERCETVRRHSCSGADSGVPAPRPLRERTHCWKKRKFGVVALLAKRCLRR